MPEPAIFLHAELLPNIRQLTLHVSLPNPPSDVDIRESSITLSESRRAVTVFTTHGKDDAKHELVETLKLPVRVTDASRRNLGFAGHRVDINTSENAQDNQTAEYSFRLQVDSHDAGSGLTKQGLREDEYVPWTANDMSTCVALHCKFCKKLIIDASADVWQWKDLPSANWAEMMDFWHCHKPDVPVHEKEQQKAVEEQNASTKGYGASNRVVASPRTVLVDVASFLVAGSDCHNIKTVSAYTPEIIRMQYSSLFLPFFRPLLFYCASS
jgi:ubiquitin-protein ligase E3 D